MNDERTDDLSARAASQDAMERWKLAGDLARTQGGEAEDLLLGLLR